MPRQRRPRRRWEFQILGSRGKWDVMGDEAPRRRGGLPPRLRPKRPRRGPRASDGVSASGVSASRGERAHRALRGVRHFAPPKR